MMNPAEFANIAKAENDFWWYRGMRQIMFGLLDPVARERRFGKVLEAGCGTGHFAQALAERYQWPMYPLDLGWEGLQYGKSLGIKRLAQGDIQALPYRDGAFDAVVSMDVIVHLPRGDEGRPMAEFQRVLRPGGFLALRASALDILRSHHSQFAMERQRFTRSRLIQLAEAHGFRVLRCTYANSLLLPVALFKFRVVEPLLGGKPESGVQPVSPWLDRLLYGPLSVEAKLLPGGTNLPLGQSLILLAERK
ncbi:MAG TPA: class I SAM-dependent methyltransferase [Bryobacteraceae bacterium]|nr:class I SAM-dependent methyltransferase [Bryobacteraceae bacterium]